MRRSGRKVLFLANTDWYLYNFRLSLADYLRGEGLDVVMVSPPGPYVDAVREAGYRWVPLEMDRRSLNPLRELLVLSRLVGILRRERPAIVHGFTVKCAVYGGLAGRVLGVPGRVGAVAGLGYVFTGNRARRRLLRPLVRALLRLGLGGAGSRLILQNPDDEILFREAGIVRADRIRLIRSSGVDCSRFRPAESSGSGSLDCEPLGVILAARLLWDKGVAEYVEAARILRGEGRRIRFLLAGLPDPGNPASVSEASIREWTKDGLVEWNGHVDDMAEILRTVDALVLPSYYREGVPRSLIEGAATGLALVTTDSPGCREVVTDGVDGLLVPPRDAQALARAIARLQDETGLIGRLGRAARDRALSEFDQEIVFGATREVYRELLPELTAAPPGGTRSGSSSGAPPPA
jgi:glycosyltransferase involved in cell wall biosynthesis